MPHFGDFPECCADLGEALRTVVQYDHALAGVALRRPEKIALVCADRRTLRNTVPGTEEIDGARLSVVLAEDCSAGAHFRRQAVVSARNGGCHFLPAELIGEKLRQGAQP